MIKLLLCLPLMVSTGLVEVNKDIVVEGMTDSRDYTYTLAQAPLSITTRMDSEDFTIIYQPNYVVNSPVLTYEFNLPEGNDFDINSEYTLTDWVGGVSLLSESIIYRESIYDPGYIYFSDLVQYAYKPGSIIEGISLDDTMHVGLINGYRFTSGSQKYLQTTISNITFQWDKFIWQTNNNAWSQDYYLVFNDINYLQDYQIGIEVSYIIEHYDYTTNRWQYEPRNEFRWYSSTEFNPISGDVPGFYIPLFSTINAFDYVSFDYQMLTNCQMTIRLAGEDGSNVEVPYSIIAPIQENSNYNEETQLLIDYFQYRDTFVPTIEPVEVDFVGWIGVAIGSFINFEIVPGFSLGGIFSVLIMCAFAIWILKMFLGG